MSNTETNTNVELTEATKPAISNIMALINAATSEDVVSEVSEPVVAEPVEETHNNFLDTSIEDIEETKEEMVFEDTKPAVNWVYTEWATRLNTINPTDAKIGPAELAGIGKLIERGALVGQNIKNLFDILWDNGGEPASVMKAHNLSNIPDRRHNNPGRAAITTSDEAIDMRLHSIWKSESKTTTRNILGQYLYNFMMENEFLQVKKVEKTKKRGRPTFELELTKKGRARANVYNLKLVNLAKKNVKIAANVETVIGEFTESAPEPAAAASEEIAA